MLGLGLGIGKPKKHPGVNLGLSENRRVVDVMPKTRTGPSGLGFPLSDFNPSLPSTISTTMGTSTTNSPESDVLATPEDIKFMDTREAKAGDPNVTLRLVSSSLGQIDSIRRDLGLIPSDIPVIPPFCPA